MNAFGPFLAGLRSGANQLPTQPVPQGHGNARLDAMLTVDQVFAAAMQLSDSDRAKLADRLLEVVADAPDTEVDDVWCEEVRRRRAEWKAGRVQALPAQEALTQMFAKP